MDESPKRIEFRPPTKFTAPEGSGTDKEFDLVCSFKMKASGELCMTKLGDIACPGYDGEKDEHDEDRESTQKPTYGRMSDSIIGGMGGTGLAGSGGMGAAGAGGY